MSGPAPTAPTCPAKEDVRAAYPLAVELRLEASRGVFERFTILLLSNSIILLGVVSALAAPRPLLDVGIVLSLFGILVCWLWLRRIRRARQRITDYGDAIETLEACMRGVTTFTQARAVRRARDATWWSRHWEQTRFQKIGAAEGTILPLILFYAYLALTTWRQTGFSPVPWLSDLLQRR